MTMGGMLLQRLIVLFLFSRIKKKKKQEGPTPDFMGIIPWDGSELRFPFK